MTRSNILDHLEETAARFPDKTVYRDDAGHLTFARLLETAKQVGSFLCKKVPAGHAVTVVAGKSVNTPIMFLGVLYAGCCYAPLDWDIPAGRMRHILENVRAGSILTDGEGGLPQDIEGEVISYGEMTGHEINDRLLGERRSRVLDTDPLCIIHTSGSSGTPKGVVLSHRNVISYLEAFSDVLDIDEGDVLGNQSPLDYVAAIRDIYFPLMTGASTVMIPKQLFSLPAKLFDYVNANDINTLFWVAPVLSMCATMDVFETSGLEHVKKVIFTGSVLPVAHLREWVRALPQAMFVNQYGSSETSATCTYHRVAPEDLDGSELPIGKPLRNAGILLIDDNGREAGPGDKGEICVRGACLSLGYYKNAEMMAGRFVQNPLHDDYFDLVYKTGDFGSLREDGALLFHGRRDFQIKHMGHRVELGEIETAVTDIEGVTNACSLYKAEKEQIWLFYCGEPEKREIAIHLRKALPAFMVPRKIAKLDEMPVGVSGKVDVQVLKGMM